MTPPSWRGSALTARATGRGPVPLRPASVGDLLDDPFVILRRHLRTILLVTAAVVIPSQLIASFLQRGSFGGLGFLDLFNDPIAAQVALESGDLGSLGAIGISVLVSLTVLPLVNGVVARVAVSSVLGEDLTPVEALRVGLARWPALLGASILAAIITFGLPVIAIGLMVTGQGALIAVGGLLLLAALPVGIGAYVAFFPVAAVVVVERVGPIDALRRSARLVRPRFFGVLGVVLLASIVASLVQTALSGVPSVAALLIGMQGGWLLLAVGGIAAELVVTPYRALVAALVYVDGRVRTEGLDLQVLVEAVPESAGAS